ncbi:MAG: DNA methyltransferase [Acidimicrobiales bacterium]
MTGEPYQLLPPLSDDEYAALKASIRAEGALVPIVIDAESGLTIDGHHRRRAIEELAAEGVKVTYRREVRHFADDEERVAFIVGSNLFRRHLSKAQRAEVVASLRERGWSLRRIGTTLGVDPTTALRDLSIVANATIPERVERKGGGSYPAKRPTPAPSIVVESDRDTERARAALSILAPIASGLIGLPRAEERARRARLAAVRAEVAGGPDRHVGAGFELYVGDFREALSHIPDHSVDCVVTDPPWNDESLPLFEDLARFVVRVLMPGRLAVVYVGHSKLPEELALLEAGGLRYMWHGCNVQPGCGARFHRRMINAGHRSVLIFSAGKYVPRRWILDTTVAEGGGRPSQRSLHPWQQAVEPARHWVRSVSEPEELVVDPFVGSGTSAIAAVMEGRRFVGADVDPACIEVTRRRLEVLAAEQDDSERA